MLFSFDALHEHSLPLLRQLLSGISTASTGGSCSCTSLFLEEAPAGLDPSSGPRNDRYSPGISASTSASTGSSEDAVSDKLYCGKCAYRVGSWSWAGARCSCGQWVVPAFQFTSSKVDAKLA
ncbi:hypothetical protein B484DRAFT_325609 [Ochromonadaceae sp. CCMP2298]|nr:hypothetical protein B484DRAFT_325609 [Ochromonadaceae sp. CCMP2298]